MKETYPARMFDCDCDIVVDMEEMGVGVEEILQYAHALIPTHALIRLSSGIVEILESRRDMGEKPRAAA